MPKPHDDESHTDFMERCMADDVMKDEFEEDKQRLAVCENMWEEMHSNMATFDREMRHLPIEGAELRLVNGENDKPSKLVGYAAVYNKRSVDLGGFTEEIAPGAFDDILRQAETVALFNHDPSNILGNMRAKPPTLRLSSDNYGLRYEIDLADTTASRDLAVHVQRGDITGSSFSFYVAEGGEEWDKRNGKPHRIVRKTSRVPDVGPVTMPAYKATKVAARSLEMAQAEPVAEPGLSLELAEAIQKNAAAQ